MQKAILFVCLLLLCVNLFAQRKNNYTKLFQVSLVPGLGTNGMHPGGYHNFFSLNITSGYSASNYLLEIGIISNLNVEETRGLQFAGIANLTGANAFAGMQRKEKDEKIRRGFEANLSGAQFSGVTNIVLSNVFGLQMTGGVNVVKGALQGFQLAGISNVVYKYSFGVQLSGLYNVSFESMDGVQTSLLGNYTKGGLYGGQIGLYNHAGFIDGKNSYENNDPTAIQIGLVNIAGKMNGFQIGLINIGKRMQGTQIGLINIYRNGTQAETRDGTAIGLINIGTHGYVRAYSNELFFLNVEVATGNSKNKRVKSDRKNIYIQNALIYSRFSSISDNSNGKWALGYGLKKFFFNRTLAPGMNNFRFFSGGIDLMHINHDDKKFTKELSLLARPGFSAGTRLHPKLRSIYLFAAIYYNFYLSNGDEMISPSFLESSSSIQNNKLDMWPGISIGVHIQ